MDKEKILKEARQEGMLGVDEGTKHAKTQGYLLGKAAFVAAYVVIALFSVITSSELNAGVTAMSVASLTGEAFAGWRQSGKKVYAVLAIIGAVTTVLAIVVAVCDMYGAQI